MDLSKLVNFWISHPNKNYGLIIHCYNSLGESFEQTYLTDPKSVSV